MAGTSATELRLLSWNVNGLRAALGKGWLEWLKQDRPHLLGLQETRARLEQLPGQLGAELEALGYRHVWLPAQKPGYSGTAVLSLLPGEPFAGLGALDPELAHWDDEGRVTGWKHPAFWLINVYFPNGGASDERLRYKLAFYAAFQDLCERLQAQGQALVVCGDLNTAHQEIDLARPRENRTVSGFLPEECAWVDGFLQGRQQAGLVDSFRHLHPEARDRYSWWSQRGGARERNVGWRLDYVFITPGLLPALRGADILDQVRGSDHCPVELRLAL